MKISTNLVKFHDAFGLKKTINIFAEAGFERIDFNTHYAEYCSDMHDADFYKEVKDYANAKGIVFDQTHAPYDSTYLDEEKTKIRFEEIVKSIKHSAWLGAKMVVTHPCRHIDYKENNNYEFMLEYNLAFYKRLLPFAEKHGIKIAIENIRGCITETPKGMLELINALNNEVFTVCCDVGHANICEQNPAGMIKALGKHIGCTHIHDNDRINDIHTLPYYGTIDWESVMKAFAEIGYEGNLNFEAGKFVNGVPVGLQKESAKYMASVGKHLVERYWHYKNTHNTVL